MPDPISSSRRTFVATAVAAPAILRAQNAPGRMKVAFIGVGNRGSYLLKHMLTVDNIEQAIERAGTKAGNKGAESAVTAIEMISLMRQL